MRFFLLVSTVIFLGLAYGTYFYIPITPASGVLDALRAENTALRADAERIKGNATDRPCLASGVPAAVYSAYPFTVKNEITINKGASSDIRAGEAVLLGCSIFVGSVSEVFPKASTVLTIYDRRLEAPIQIGEHRVNGLFRGGNSPVVSLVEKDIFSGEAVFLADKRFPYGLMVGTIGSVRSGNGGSVLKEADLIPAFSISELRDIFIVR